MWRARKDSDAGRDWGQEEKGTTEDEMAGWHHRLDGHEFGWTPGIGDGQGGLACCDSWGRKESDMTELNIFFFFFFFKEPLPFRDIFCLHVSEFCMLELIPVPLSRMTIYTDVVWWSILRFDGETCLRFALKRFGIGPRAIGRIYNWSKEMYVQCWNRLVMSIWEFEPFCFTFLFKNLQSRKLRKIITT